MLIHKFRIKRKIENWNTSNKSKMRRRTNKWKETYNNNVTFSSTQNVLWAHLGQKAECALNCMPIYFHQDLYTISGYYESMNIVIKNIYVQARLWWDMNNCFSKKFICNSRKALFISWCIEKWCLLCKI